jgi:hypothetical protein
MKAEINIEAGVDDGDPYIKFQSSEYEIMRCIEQIDSKLGVDGELTFEPPED